MDDFEYEFIIYILITLGFLFILYVQGDKVRLNMIKNDFTNIHFLFVLAIVILLTYIGLKQEDPHIRTSTRHAITATIASYCSHLSLVFPAFFFVGIATLFSVKHFN